MLYAIDQFVMGGGGLIVMLDPYTRFNRASNLVNPKPSSELNDISDLLDKYGLSYNSNWVIGDSSFSAMAVDRNVNDRPRATRLGCDRAGSPGFVAAAARA